ncbi:MAG: MmcQ/YjbR family DNA-binding protein [Bacteroidota bacterium]
MNIEEYYEYCSGLPGTEEGFPFDEYILVFKVGGKIYALTHVEEFNYINLKCDPDRAVALRAEYEDITPGYHMSKKHWNSVGTRGALEDDLIRELIKDSYTLILNSLPKKAREDVIAGNTTDEQ